MTPIQLVSSIIMLMLAATAFTVVIADELSGRPIDPTMTGILTSVLGFVFSTLGVHIGATTAASATTAANAAVAANGNGGNGHSAI